MRSKSRRKLRSKTLGQVPDESGSDDSFGSDSDAGSISDADLFGSSDLQVDYATMQRMQELVRHSTCSDHDSRLPRLCSSQLVRLQQQLAERDEALTEAREIPGLLFKVCCVLYCSFPVPAE